MFTELCKHTPTFELVEIRRHRDPGDPSCEHPWLADYQAALHAGRGEEALAVLQEHDALKLHDTRAEAMVALVEDWDTWRLDHPVGDAMLLVHGTNGDVDTVNELAQHVRLDAGELGARSVRAPDCDYDLREGDAIVLRGAPLRLPTGHRIENGTRMRITAIDEAGDRLTLSFTCAGAGEQAATLDLAALRRTGPGARRPALRLAYAMHPNSAQGATVARSAALGHPAGDRGAVYVADTRPRYGHAVHLSREDLGDGTDAERLARHAAAISDDRSRAASIAYSRDASRRIATYRDVDR